MQENFLTLLKRRKNQRRKRNRIPAVLVQVGAIYHTYFLINFIYKYIDVLPNIIITVGHGAFALLDNSSKTYNPDIWDYS